MYHLEKSEVGSPRVPKGKGPKAGALIWLDFVMTRQEGCRNCRAQELERSIEEVRLHGSFVLGLDIRIHGE